jgi:hypothetical protein
MKKIRNSKIEYISDRCDANVISFYSLLISITQALIPNHRWRPASHNPWSPAQSKETGVLQFVYWAFFIIILWFCD